VNPIELVALFIHNRHLPIRADCDRAEPATNVCVELISVVAPHGENAGSRVGPSIDDTEGVDLHQKIGVA
jgi:hypothetical protein